MRFFLVIFLMVITVTAVVIKSFFPQKIKGKNIPATLVDVVPAKKMLIPTLITANGIVKSVLSVDIVPDVPGKVMKIFFQSGQQVHAGDILLELDHDIISAKIEEAEAKYTYQKRNFNRYLELSKHGVVAKDNIDNLKSQLDQELAQIHSLKAELEKCIIRAPFSGTLGISNVSVGQYIQPAEKIVNLKNDESMVLDLMVPSKYINSIHLGQSVGIEKIENKCGRVEALDTKIDSHTSSLVVRVQIKNCHIKPVTGNFMTAFIFTSMDSFLAVPATALTYSLDGSSVFAVRDNKANRIPVEADLYNDLVVIKEGKLHSGDLIVSAGQEKLIDGSKVKVHVG